jgi:predicted HTH transcriptional regulator
MKTFYFEITSYGTLQQGVSKEEFFQGVSVPRSKEVMRIYRDMDLVEQLGSGIPRILKTYGETCFYFSENYTRMSFPIDKEFQKNVTDKVTDKVTDNQMKILQLIQKNERITTNELAIHLNISQRKIKVNIAKLKEVELLLRVGSSKSGYWKVIDKDEQ